GRHRLRRRAPARMIPETDARQAIALAGQDWSVSQIARRLGHDRKTIRIYLNGHRAPGQPRPPAASFAPSPASLRPRAAAASHLPAGAITACLPPWFAAQAAACDDLAATGQPQPADIAHLAALTGTSETALRHTLPALAGGGRPPVRATLACRRCAARH